jgi:hypothetical protein
LKALDDYGYTVEESGAGFLAYPKPKGVPGVYVPPAMQPTANP